MQVKRVAERIIAVLEESPDSPTHIVTAAAWPNAQSSSFYSELLKNDEEFDPKTFENKILEHPPSATAISALMPFCPESSNPTKVFNTSDWKIYIIDLVGFSCLSLHEICSTASIEAKN